MKGTNRDLVARSSQLLRYVSSTVPQVLSGVASFVRALVLVVNSDEAVTEVARRIPALFACLAISTFLLWVSCYPLRWLGLLVLRWENALHRSALVLFPILFEFRSKLSGKAFFAVLAARDKALSERIHALPKLHSLQSHIWKLVKTLVLCMVVCAAVVAGLLAVGPAVAGALAALAVGSWFIIPCVVMVVVMVLILVAFGLQVSSFLQPFAVLWKRVDPVVAIMTLAVVLLRIVHIGSMVSLVKAAAVLYISCLQVTHTFLAPFSQRQETQKWNLFREQHRWRLFGFGLPVWVLWQFFEAELPMMVVVAASLLTATLFELLRAGAGSLLADLLALQEDQNEVQAVKHS